MRCRQGLAEALKTMQSWGQHPQGALLSQPHSHGAGSKPLDPTNTQPHLHLSLPQPAEEQEPNLEVGCRRGATGEAVCRRRGLTSCSALFGHASVPGLHHLEAHPCRWSQNLTRQKDRPVLPIALLQGTAQTSYRPPCSSSAPLSPPRPPGFQLHSPSK